MDWIFHDPVIEINSLLLIAKNESTVHIQIVYQLEEDVHLNDRKYSF